MTHQVDTAAVLPVVGKIYDAALDPRQWPDALSATAALFEAERALLFTPGQSPLKDGSMFPLGIPDWAMHLWETKYAEQDVWVQVSLERGFFFEGNVVTDVDLYPHDQLLTTAYYQELLVHIGIARMLSGVIFGADSPVGPTTILCTYRDAAGREFGVPERTLCSLLIPHLSRALGIMFRLRDAELKVASSLGALDRIRSGIVLLGRDSSVVFANRTAQSILQREDGISLRQEPRGRAVLYAHLSNAQRALHAAIAQCSTLSAMAVPHFSQAVRVERLGGKSAYLINLSALPAGNEFGTGTDQAGAIAFICDPDQPVCLDQGILTQVYRLTPAECRVAMELCSGETLARIAERLGIRESTVKTQLLSIFDKTGTHRRVELVKLLLSLASASA